MDYDHVGIAAQELTERLHVPAFPEELWFRMRGMLAVTAVDCVEVYQQCSPACMSPVAGEAAQHWAITFLTAAMSAPPTGT